MPSNKKCSNNDCERPFYCKGFCQLHYERWKRNGDPNRLVKPLSPRGAPLKWLNEHVNFEGCDCLVWPFSRGPCGRAHMRGVRPSRYMCEAANGPSPSKTHEAAHSCGNAHLGFVNPRHLRWATPKENAADKIIHGTLIKGEKHYAAKLNQQKANEIKSLLGSVKQSEIAKMFQISKQLVNSIKMGRRRS